MPVAGPRLELAVETARGEERRFSLPAGKVHLGFGADASLLFSARPVSWRVCTLRGDGRGWSVVDCREPVKRNGQLLTGPAPLGPGDRLDLGRVALRVLAPGQAPAASHADDPFEAQLRAARASSRQNLGRYLLLSELGSGAFSTVHRAWDEQQRRFVAVKVLVQLAPSIRARFAREVVLGQGLDHPNIVRVLDHGEHDRRPYLVLELAEGRTLDALAEDEPLPVRRAVELVRDVALAIEHAHARGVLHRDLKPQNVIVGDDGRARVLDFGLARLIREQGPRLTTTGALVGTPLYLAPEQALGDGDERSDVYSLGALLYVAAAGQPPIDASSLDRYLDALLRERPDPPSRARPEIDPALDAICLRCLEKDPALRYAGARALVDDLDRWLAGAPFRPSAPPALVRVARWAARHRLQVQLGAVAACFLLAAAVAVAVIET
jgi:eukaryotic-like serine/threonine-protein kinase